jgi:hypothetical protein
MLYPIVIIALFFTIISSMTTFASDFDGSKPLYGSVEKILEINQFKIKDEVHADSAGLPQNFVIDFKTRRMRPSKDSLVRKTTNIRHVEHPR